MTSLAELVRERAAAGGGRVERFEFGWLPPSRRRREIAAIAAPLSTSGQGVVFTLADVTEQHLRREREHAQQAELTHASRLSLMGQMASALAHELGQPLNACQSYLSGLRLRLGDELVDRPDLLAALDKASQHLDQAGQIIRNVRGFVARGAPEPSPVDLPALVGQTLRLLELPIRAARVRTIVVAAEALPPARANPVEIQQVLVNLVINAIEAMVAVPAEDRAVQIRLLRDARGMVCIEVADRGPGIAVELAPRIFEPYVTSKTTGLGMGLMISRTIVESHGGALRLVRQKAPGATLRFTLPAWEAV
jgi:C4-dicarboxylate-specific signal transduction histidine kinase